MEHLPIEQLGIEQWELEGLQWFVQAARDGTLKPVSSVQVNTKFSREGKDQPLFNMGTANDNLECGTAACVGGWIFLHKQGAISREKAFAFRWEARTYVQERGHGNKTINRLFYPWESKGNGWGDKMSDDVKHAADVVERFLKTGVVSWKRS